MSCRFMLGLYALLGLMMSCHVVSAQNVWTLSSSHCTGGGNCLQFPSDTDCDCDNNLASPNAQCLLFYNDIRVTDMGMPQPVGTMTVVCNNCGACCGGTVKTCGGVISHTISTSISVTVGTSVSGSVGVPGGVNIQAAINYSVGATAGGSMTTSGNCAVTVQPCEHSDIEGISFTVSMGRQWEVLHEWQFRSTWATGSGCFFSDGVCPIDGQVWIVGCTDAVPSTAQGNVLHSGINCGGTVNHDCP